VLGTLISPFLILSANSLIFASYGLIAGFDVAYPTPPFFRS